MFEAEEFGFLECFQFQDVCWVRHNPCNGTTTLHMLQRRPSSLPAQGRWLSLFLGYKKKHCVYWLSSKLPDGQWRICPNAVKIIMILSKAKTHENWRKWCGYIRKMLPLTRPWFQCLICKTVAFSCFITPTLLSWLTPIWLSSVHKHEATFDWKPVWQCFWPTGWKLLRKLVIQKH